MEHKNGGNVVFHFKGEDKELKSKLSSATSSLKNAGALIGKAVVAGTAMAGVAIAGLVKKSVQAYSEFEQLEGGLEALFGKGSKEMQDILKTSEDAYKNLTMSQNQYLKAFEGSYSIIKNGIGKNADAIKYTNSMIQMSTDLYNTYGGTVETYQSAINWALKGTYSYLDNLNVGIKGTKEGFIEAANNSGILNKNIKDTSELTNDQILDVIQYYVKSAGALGRTQKEAASTIQGSMNMMKSSWENLVAGFSKDGADVNKLTKQFIKSASTFITQLIPIVKTALYSILDALPGLISTITAQMPAFMTSIIQTLIKLLPQLITMTIKLMVDVINALATALPTIIPELITAILDGIMTLLDNIDKLIDCGTKLLYGLIDGLIYAIPVLVEKAPIIIIKLTSAIIRALPLLLKVFLGLPMKLWVSMAKQLPDLIKNVPTIIKKIISALKGEAGKIKDAGKNIIKGLWKGAGDMKDWVVDKFKGLGKSILSGMKKALGIKSPSREFAKIGKYSIVGYEVGVKNEKQKLLKLLDNLSVAVQKQLKGKNTNYKDIGKQLGKEFVSGIDSGINTIKNIKDKIKSSLSNVDLFSNGQLTDLATIKKQVQQYGNNLKKLKSKLPTGLYSQIAEMDREEGLNYTSQLLAMNEKDLKAYINNYNSIQKLSTNYANDYYNTQVKTITTKYSNALQKEFKSINKLMGGIGKNATKGLINGMLSQLGSVNGASKTISKNVINSLKKALKIKSPSRVMMELGEYTTEGYIEGIASMKQDLNKMMADTFSLSPTLTGTMNNTLRPDVNVSVVNNVETDPLGQVVNKIKTFSGGAKNDYNYGYGG